MPSFEHLHPSPSPREQANGGLAIDRNLTAPGRGAVKFTAASEPGDSRLPEMSIRNLGPLFQVVVSQVRARWWAGVLAALVVGGLLPWLLFHGAKESVAETSLLAQGPLDKILNLGEAQVAEQRQENALRNHISVMSSNSFRARLAQSFSREESSAVQKPYLTEGAAASPERLGRILDANIDIARERGRDLFLVRARHYSPETALLLADRFASEYIKFIQDDFNEQGRGGMAMLEKQANSLTEDIRRIETERRDYRKALGFISIEENRGVIGDRLRRISAALSDARITRLNLDAQVAAANAAGSSTSAASRDNPILAAFGTNLALRTELSRLVSQREVLAAQYGPNHPRMIENERAAAGLRQTLEDGYAMARVDLQSKASLALAAENQLNAELAKAFNESLGIDEQAGNFNTLGEELTAKTKAQASLLQHIAQTAVLLQMPTHTLRVIDAAYLVSDSRRQALILVSFGFLAVVAFVAAPLVVYSMDGTLSAGTDLEQVLGTELLGAIPRLGRTKAKARPHLVRENQNHSVVDSFLSIVDRIELRSASSKPKTLLITSTLPAEGKSMIASNLASAFTRIGRRTILVDCDLRRSVQRAIHGIADTKGILSWTADGAPLSDALLDVDGPLGVARLADGTFLLPAGGCDPEPTRLLIGASIGRLFQRLTAQFDVVLIDTPPAGVFQDALLLAKYCSGTILVGREGKARTAQVVRVLREFDQTQAPAIGLVLNAFSRYATHPAMAYRTISAKYGYGRSDLQKNLQQTGVATRSLG